MRSWAYWAISAPWSQLKGRRSCPGQLGDRDGDRITDSLSAVPSERRPVLRSGSGPVTFGSRSARGSMPCPPPVRSTAVTPADQPNLGTRHGLAVGSGDLADQAIL